MTPEGVYSASIAQGAPGTTEVVPAPGARRKIVILGYVVVMDAEGSVKFRSAGDDKTGAMGLSAKGGIVNPSVRIPLGENAALMVVSTGGAANGHVLYEVANA